LVVDARLLQASNELGISPQASPEKWLMNVTLADALRILERLGSTVLSLPEYFQVRRDALLRNDRNMLGSLESDQFIEMLATVFVPAQTMIHLPRPEAGISFAGTEIQVHTPEGRYGWIHPDEIDPGTGLPTRVTHVRNLRDETIKYWDSHT